MIPDELLIDGVTWTVTLSSGMDDFGETDINECRVSLRENVNEQVREITFWHELVHALFATRDFKLNPDASADELEEQVASFLGPALWSFFRTNAEIEWS